MASKNIVLFIEGSRRFKVKTCYFSVLINYFKGIGGRYYDHDLHEWSFPIEEKESMIKFIEKQGFGLHVVKAEKFVRLMLTCVDVEMSFDAYSNEFAIFQEIEGAHYDRTCSKYIIPRSKLNELEKI